MRTEKYRQEFQLEISPAFPIKWCPDEGRYEMHGRESRDAEGLREISRSRSQIKTSRPSMESQQTNAHCDTVTL